MLISSVTVTSHDALRLVPSVVVAVIVAVPEDLAVTRPLLLTVATDVLLDFHVTVLFVALLGNTVAVNCMEYPLANSALVLFKEIDVARTTFCLTVTEQDALRLLPSVVLAVIIAVPGFFAVTRPLLLTVATELLLVVHVTVLFVALLGSTVADNCMEYPSVNSALVLFKEIDVARTTFCLTVTEQDALRLLPSVVVAVMVALPGDFAVTRPLLLTVATELLLVVHVTVLFVALLGSTVADNCIVLPSVNSALIIFKEIDVASASSSIPMPP